MNNFRFVFILVTLSLLLLGCNEKVDRVRVIGEKIIVRQNENGKIFYDTIATTAPSFCFKNQDTRLYCNADLKGKVYLVDFFFTHCPSICVKMKRNMLTIQNEFKNQDRFAITSFTIDPARDSASVLASYAAKLGVDTKQWSFLTGNRDSIYYLYENFDKLPCMIRNGMNDTIIVNGKMYYQPMYPINLNDVEIANLMNFMQDTFMRERQEPYG
jgi:protein SCO1/2